MSEARWGTDKPTVAGWYWWRGLDETEPWPLIVVMVDGVLKYRRWKHDVDWTLNNMRDGEWLGPITPDAYAAGRVAGLKEAERYALTCVKELQDKIRDIESGKYTLVGAQTKEGVEAWVHAKTLQANRISKWITSHIAQIEAQAQGGESGAI